MSAKLLHSLSGENPDLQKQIGCMNGIFQLFDRHHFLSGRRSHQNHRRLPPASGSGQGDNHGTKRNTALRRRPREKEQKKAVKEKQRISAESCSSSSCSSSFSSIDNRHSHPQPSSYGQENFPGDLPIYQPNNSLQISRNPVDIRDVVKDSMYREAREILVKTSTKENVGGQTLKYMDSPRPLQQPESVKSRDLDQNESFRVLAKLREASWSSSKRKNGIAAKDAPRFSYDGRESRDSMKSTIKLKELPRLSLDSRKSSMRGSTTEMKSNYLLGDLQRVHGNSNNILNLQQEPGSNKRPSSVVAKLMGLETFPDAMSTSRYQPSQTEIFSDVECNSFSRLSRTIDENKQNQISGSPRNSINEPVSPWIKNADSVKKPIANSKFPKEPAPWKQQDGSKGQTPASQSRETPTRSPNSSLSVYGEIEKRLAQLEFKKSGKDLRALKQILDAMQKNREISESRKEDQASNFVSQTGNNNSVDQSSKLPNFENLKGGCPTSIKTKGTSSPKSFRSPIVVMKAAISMEKSCNSASFAIQNETLSGLQRLRIGDSAAGRKESVENRTKDPTPRSNHLRHPSSRPLHPTNKNTNVKSSRSGQISKSSHPTTGKNNSNKAFEPLNQRLEQKKLRMERHSHLRTPSSELSRSRGQPMESGSLHRKSRYQSPHLQQSVDHLSDISLDVRYLSLLGDATSLQSGSCISLGLNVDSEVSSIDRSDKISGAFFLHSQRDPASGYIGDKSTVEPALEGPEQPSPVSVLDTTFDRDEPPSPLKKTAHAFTDDEALNSNEAEWSAMDLNHINNCIKPRFSSENDYNKLQNMKHLVRNDVHIYPTHEKSIIDEIATIYESTDPNHRYISEIFLASGLLRDAESDIMSIKLHPSGHLINPNLFFVLEQTKACIRLPNVLHKGKKIIHSESTTETHRKLVFDAVNEILVQKLSLQVSSKKWFSPSKLTQKRSSMEQLLRDVCSEVDRLQANNSNCNLDDEDDSMTSIIWEDLKHRSMDWTDCQSEISWLVLDVERLIFKDLISEVVRNETASLQGHPGRHCRKLFSQ